MSGIKAKCIEFGEKKITKYFLNLGKRNNKKIDV